MRRLVLLCALPLLAGCVVAEVAKTAVAVATVPVKIVSAGVDAATTSQSEADERRGRELRKADEKRARQARRARQRCLDSKPLPTDDCTALRPR